MSQVLFKDCNYKKWLLAIKFLMLYNVIYSFLYIVICILIDDRISEKNADLETP